MTAEYVEPVRPPHPVSLDVEYPERLSRWKIFVKIILAIPQLIVVYLLQTVVSILSVIAWFAILFTGRYPKSFFAFSSGALRWQANVIAYVALLRDEYPPFSLEAGEYPLTFDVPYPERQSRFRLFIRWFAIITNQVVFFFVAIAWWFVTFISWFVILLTGRYPRGLFKFSVGALRWHLRAASYQYLLRDEYPPYSVNADARPGNEVLSAIIGVPLIAAYIALSLLPFAGLLGGGHSDVHVAAATLNSPAALARERPSGRVNNLRITLLDYNDDATPPRGTNVRLTSGYRWVSVRVRAEKDGFWPTFFMPLLFSLRDCSDHGYAIDTPATDKQGKPFAMFWRNGSDEKDVYFQFPAREDVCELRYYAGLGQIRFVID